MRTKVPKNLPKRQDTELCFFNSTYGSFGPQPGRKVCVRPARLAEADVESQPVCTQFHLGSTIRIRKQNLLFDPQPFRL